MKHLTTDSLEVISTLLFLMLLFLLLPNAFSTIPANSSIPSSGSISKLSPLQAVGSNIEDASGNVIFLRGCGTYQYIMDPTGWWNPMGTAWFEGHCVWNESAIRYHLRAMKSWGMNLLRIHTCAEWWIQDVISIGEYVGSYRYNIKRTIQIAEEEGVYVIMDLAAIKNGIWYYNDGNSRPLACIPLAPYESADEKTVFPTNQSFIDYWVSVANTLKDCPNALFELFNEPNQGNNNVEMVQRDWFSAAQRCINAIRATGSTNMIVIQWGWAVAPNGPTLSWVEDYPLMDPSSNILYSTHLYRTYFNPTWGPAYDYQTALDGMIYCKVQYVLQTLNKPLIIGEMGVNMFSDNNTKDGSGLTELQKELAWAKNILSICNQWGIDYSAWDWTIIDQWHLISLNGLPAPSEWGQVLKDAIAEGGT